MKRAFCKLTAADIGALVLVCAFLALLVVPAGLHARGYGRQAQCLANVQILGRGWVVYAADNDDRIMNGHVPRDASYANTAYWLSRGYSDNAWWVDPPHNENGLYTGDPIPCPLEDERLGIESGRLFPYVQTAAAYHCPQDQGYLNTMNRSGKRSYSITGLMNGEDMHSARTNVMTAGAIVSPSKKCVFLENLDERGWNMGSWIMIYDYWIDPFAIWHRSQTTLGFADGHGESHSWVEASTFAIMRDGRSSPIDWTAGEDADFLYMRRAYVPAEDIE
jgi:hypothetical protein